MSRPSCLVYIACSLDGFIARPDGGLDWLDRVHVPGEDYGYAAFFASIDTVFIGRRTWDVVRGFPEWPYVGKRVVVASRSPAAALQIERAPAEVQVVGGDLLAALDDLAAAGARRVYVDGGELIRALLAAGAIEELTVSIIPVLLGEGVRLFDRGPEVGLQLAACRSWDSGLVPLRYRKL